MTLRPETAETAFTDLVPLVTPNLAGCGGVLRATPEDFEVEEIPAYQPSGEGDHLFLWIEKRERNTREVAQEIARALKISERDVGFAGLKDRNALTRQFFSVPAPRGGALAPGDLGGASWRVLSVTRHANKLKTGHLRGNRFHIRIRDAQGSVEGARAIARRLEAVGLPNAFGPQRFGRDGRNAALGRALLLREPDRDLERVRRDRFLRRLCISAYQSLLFNRVLGERLREGLFQTALEGDLMKKCETGGLFISEDPGADTPRLANFEIAPTGPIFGHRMMRPRGEAWAKEARILDAEGITLDAFAFLKGDAEGSRRALRIPLSIDVSEERDAALRLDFSLPKGAFATAVLREVMKVDVGLPPQLDEA